MLHVDNGRCSPDGITCNRRTYRNATQAVDIVRDLLDSRSDAEIADCLNSFGLSTTGN
ncbi:hypothetical protein [Streptomyces capoamus]|uniref:hypothetical protein n=1 Tax=Streptomyces capoamus TaxID=68183 RepID=UPI001674BF3C|nr:hypothetical protein [Streptomyces capoamus]